MDDTGSEKSGEHKMKPEGGAKPEDIHDLKWKYAKPDPDGIKDSAIIDLGAEKKRKAKEERKKWREELYRDNVKSTEAVQALLKANQELYEQNEGLENQLYCQTEINGILRIILERETRARMDGERKVAIYQSRSYGVAEDLCERWLEFSGKVIKEWSKITDFVTWFGLPNGGRYTPKLCYERAI